MVVSQEGDRPVRKASVTLSLEGSLLEGRKEAQTDVEGRFEFKELAAGRYRLSVGHPTFVGRSRSTRATTTTVTLADDEHEKGVVFRLAPGAVIRGRVMDEDGDSMPRVMVNVLQQRYLRGRRQVLPMGGATTDDLGEFRIHSLLAGRYYVSASPGNTFTAAATDAQKDTKRYVRMFYPGALELAGASPIEVRSGEEVPLNLSLVKAETVLVRGTVLTSAGEKGASGAVYFSPVSESMSFGQFPAQIRDGAFEARVVPGRCRITAMVDEPGQASSDSMSFVSMRVDVAPQGMESIKLVTGSAKVTVRVRVEGATDVKYENIFVSLMRRPDDEDDMGSMAMGGASGRATKEGVVVMERVATGLYDVTWGLQGSPPQDWYLKSVVWGTHDVTASGVRIGSGAVELQVVISATAARVEGAVLDADQHGVQGAFVGAVPEGERRKRDQGYRTTVSDQSGRFLLRGLQPGRYTLLALEDPEPGVWMDPDFLKTVEDKGDNLSVSENERKQMQLRVIPAGQAPK